MSYPNGEVQCPGCYGATEVPIPEDRWRWPSDPERRMEWCGHCVGTGSVTKAKAKRLERLRQNRGWL